MKQASFIIDKKPNNNNINKTVSNNAVIETHNLTKKEEMIIINKLIDFKNGN